MWRPLLCDELLAAWGAAAPYQGVYQNLQSEFPNMLVSHLKPPTKTPKEGPTASAAPGASVLQ